MHGIAQYYMVLHGTACWGEPGKKAEYCIGTTLRNGMGDYYRLSYSATSYTSQLSGIKNHFLSSHFEYTLNAEQQSCKYLQKANNLITVNWVGR